MKVSAKLNNLRVAPRKVRIVAKLVKGMAINDAFDQLDIHIRKTAPYMKKLLESAIANGENNFGIDKDNMFISDVVVDAGPTLKRWRARAFGRAGKILKRTSKIELVISERVEGKGRKTKEEIEKEKQAKIEVQKKVVKEREKADKKATETNKVIKADSTRIVKKDTEKEGRKGDEKSWKNKIFRRKSM